MTGAHSGGSGLCGLWPDVTALGGSAGPKEVALTRSFVHRISRPSSAARWALSALLWSAAAGAAAQSAPPPTAVVTEGPSEEDDLPIPTLEIERIPPNTSYEFAVQVGFGEVAYFRDVEPAWVGFGFRGGWGKNFAKHRLGIAGAAVAEGSIGIHTQLAFEPSVTWDFVAGNGLALGVGLGPAAVVTLNNETVVSEYGFRIAPTATARVGWSQTWSRVGRRLFLFLEPKVRLVDGDHFSPSVALAVGSGQGR
jgi:hypothetical protein